MILTLKSFRKFLPSNISQLPDGLTNKLTLATNEAYGIKICASGMRCLTETFLLSATVTVASQ